MHIHSTALLPATEHARYQSIAFDGSFFYCTDKCVAQIVVINDQLETRDCISTSRRYACLCYDPVLCCFWASGEGCFGSLFRLDQKLQEVDQLRISPICACITGLSYCAAADCLLISTPCEILRVDKSQREPPRTIYLCRDSFLSGVCCVGAGYLFHRLLDGKQQLLLSTTEQATPTLLPLTDDLLQNIVYVGLQNDLPTFYLLITRHGRYSSLQKATLPRAQLGALTQPAEQKTPSHAHTPAPPSPPTADGAPLSPLLAFAFAAAEQAIRQTRSPGSPSTIASQLLREEDTDPPPRLPAGGFSFPCELPAFLYRQPLIYPPSPNEEHSY